MLGLVLAAISAATPGPVRLSDLLAEARQRNPELKAALARAGSVEASNPAREVPAGPSDAVPTNAVIVGAVLSAGPVVLAVARAPLRRSAGPPTPLRI